MKLAQGIPAIPPRQDGGIDPEIQRLKTENQQLRDRIRDLEEQLRNSSEYEKSLTEQAIKQKDTAVRERDEARQALEDFKHGVQPSKPDQPGSEKPPVPPPPVPREANVPLQVQQACGLVVPDNSGAPGAKPTILVAQSRRQAIDRELQLPNASPADVQTIDADVCFAPLDTDHAIVLPHKHSSELAAVIPDDDAQLEKWLTNAAPRGDRLRLAPSAECNAILDLLSARGAHAAAAWVEQDDGLSRCEHSAGGVLVDPAKISGYSGVIVLKLRRE